MVQLTVVRWNLFGHDRLYANLPDGTPAGWADCRTGTITVLLGDYGDPVAAALRPHLPSPAKVSVPEGAARVRFAEATERPAYGDGPGREGPATGRLRKPEGPASGRLRTPEGSASGRHRGMPGEAERGRLPASDAGPRRGSEETGRGGLSGFEGGTWGAGPVLGGSLRAASPSEASGEPAFAGPAPALPLLPPLTPPDDLAAPVPGTGPRGGTDGSSPGPVTRALARVLGRPAGNAGRGGSAPERRVGAELDRLRRHGWHVLHSLPLPGDVDLDHLLIGPGGVFTVTARNHPGQSVRVGDDAVTVDQGEPRPYLARSLAEAERVRRVLGGYCGFPVPVEPVLVFVGVTDLEVVATQLGVRVYREREVSSLAPLGGVWTALEVDRIHNVARHRRAWLEA